MSNNNIHVTNMGTSSVPYSTDKTEKTQESEATESADSSQIDSDVILQRN